MYGGHLDLNVYRDSWYHGNLQPGRAAALGAGCSGSVGTPQLTATTPFLGSNACEVGLVTGYASAPAATVLSFTARTWNLGPACAVHLDAAAAFVLVLTSPAGFASMQFAIPQLAALRGATLHSQGVVLDPATALGVAVTNALSLIVGD